MAAAVVISSNQASRHILQWLTESSVVGGCDVPGYSAADTAVDTRHHRVWYAADTAAMVPHECGVLPHDNAHYSHQ